ncbi:type II secretion system protein GspL [Pseudomonas versuta]|uniref:Type II secretion system protein L n=1 Tax=Pseudomonas versuta TaxID=1788301 RepID=A0ABX3E8X8_9PSED|nr:type II secretion system protein GspL [Pseudomonas versuta]ALE90059.1 hypothetical protein AOC04_18560 [Pseudomonas versuta]OKA20993.1 hypothetical protein BOH73_11540 [Pseudomonas versuta]
MKSWLYLTAEGFSRGDETDLDDAPVCFWQDPLALHRTSLNEAVRGLEDHSIHLILPMHLCSWLLTDPWPGRRRPTVQSLAFSVEEQLADDLDAVHIGVGRADAQQRYPLLIIHKQRFKDLLAQLRRRGLNIVSVQVDADMLPRDKPCAAWWDGRWIIGGALPARLVLSAQDLEAIKATLPPEIVWLHTEAQAAFSAQQAIDLLQGEFKQATRRLPWYGISAALLVVFSLGLGFSHLRSGFLEEQTARLHTLSEQRFRALYPEQTRIVDLSAQLRHLQQQDASGPSGHMRRLLQLTEQVIGASSVEVQSMEWQAAAGWTLNITASSFTELEHLRARGVQSGLPVILGNASQQGRRVQALLTLKDDL